MHNYNATRKPIILKEYGRHVQQLVEAMQTIQDKAARTAHAKSILKLMAVLEASKKQGMESIQKRWDALFIMADYSLDVDCPYPMPEKGVLDKPLKRPTYTKQPIKFRSYGRNVDRLVQKAITMEASEAQEAMVIDILRLMKFFSNTWNKDNVDTSVLLTNLQRISDNKLTIDAEKVKTQNIFSVACKDKKTAKQTTNTGKKRKPHEQV